jgi:signal transduction histidine kinase
MTNAVKHSNAKEIDLRLEVGEKGLTLTISDNGVGMPAKIPGGMGLRTMAYRASAIGAAFNIERQLSRGTRVTCTLPAGGFISETHDTKD